MCSFVFFELSGLAESTAAIAAVDSMVGSRSIGALMRLVLVFLVTGVLSRPALAFEMNGFRSFMPQEEALRMFQSRMDRVTPVQNSRDQPQTYLGTRSVGNETESLSFCGGRLISYSFDVRGGLGAFLRLIERDSTSLGQGRYEASTHETPVGAWNMLKFSWRIGPDTKEVAISKIADDSEQVTISYVAQDHCP